VEPAEQDDDDFDMPDDDYVDSGDEESYYEKSLRSRGLGEGQGDFEKALDTLSGSYSGWYPDEQQSDPDVKTYWYDDGEGGYYASGNIEQNLRTGEITVDFEDKDGYHGGDVQGTFANMGAAMRALRGGPGSHGGRAPNYDRLAQRTQYGPDDLRKTDRTGRKGTVSGGFANARKASIQHSLGKHGPKGVLPESGVAEGIFGSKQSPALPVVNKIASVASKLNAQNVDAGRQIIQSHAAELERMLNPQAKTGVDVIEQDIAEAGANTKSFRSGYSKRKDTKPLSPEEQAAKDKAKSDKWLEKERAKMAAKKSMAKNLDEFAPGRSGDSGNYFQELARAWYNGVYDSGSLQKGIKTNQDIERLLQRGVVAPDGKTRKYNIDYNSDFDGVIIFSDDYYEHGDENDAGQDIDIRTGQVWGPYDYMVFSHDELSESVAEEVKLPYPVRSEKLGRANMELLIRAYNEPTGPRTTLSFGNRILELDRDDVEAIAQYYDNVLRDDNARWNFITGIMSDPDGLTDTLVKLGRRKTQAVRQPGLFQEADKKKEDDIEPQVKDVALQRAITRAKADFPTAGTGIEALAKDFMRSQDQDQKSFDQIRQAERQQSQILNQINKIDQEQEKEIKDLESQNSGLASRLQQLQSVNSRLEKKLAAMSGRKAKTKDVEPMPVSFASSGTPEPVVKGQPQKKKPAKAAKSKASKITKPSAPAQIARTEPTQPSAISSMTRQLTTQHPDVLEPAADFVRGAAPRFSTVGAQDVVPRTPRQVSSQAAQDISKGRMADMTGSAPAYTSADTDELRKIQQDQMAMREDNKESKPERPEADYGDEYQAMVQRVGQKAKQGPRKTVWDPVKRVYKTVPVNPVKEQEPGNRAGYNAIKSVNDWAEKLRTMQELQKDVKLMADPEARTAVQQRIGELLKFGIQQGYTK